MVGPLTNHMVAQDRGASTTTSTAPWPWQVRRGHVPGSLSAALLDTAPPASNVNPDAQGIEPVSGNSAGSGADGVPPQVEVRTLAMATRADEVRALNDSRRSRKRRPWIPGDRCPGFLA
jgi:hypothetical protein